jgi:hypothetical protein
VSNRRPVTPDHAPQHGAPHALASGGIRRGPTIALLRLLARLRVMSWLGAAVDGLLAEVGDGEPVPRALVQTTASAGTALWAVVALLLAGLAVVVSAWATAIVDTFAWAAAPAAIACALVWAGRAVWWNLRLASAKGKPVPVRAKGLTEWFALAVGFGWGLYWARPH